MKEGVKLDRRDEFKNEHAQQGRLLFTKLVLRFSQLERNKLYHDEKCRMFVRFSELDEGRSRILVKVFKTAKACEEAVKKHNYRLKKALKHTEGNE